METAIRLTPLNSWHRNHGANMAIFGGYEMPLWYSSIKNEHLSVLTRAGIFDTSHMAVVIVAGADAYELLQFCFTTDMNRCIGKNKKALYAGRCVYGAFLDKKGQVIDDSIIYKFDGNAFMVVVNAGMGARIAAHLMANQARRRVMISDLTDQIGKIDIQGPHAATILARVLDNPEKIFKDLPYFSFKGHFDANNRLADTVRLTGGTPVLLSRTGYTGEFGFEIYTTVRQVVKIWEQIFKAGQDLGLVACGLAARDSLRAGAVLPLSHQDIGNWSFVNHPWHFALPFNGSQTSFTKSFIGDKALLHVKTPEYTYAFVGKDLRKVSTEDQAKVLDFQGNEIGQVLTCVSDMGIGLYNGRIFSVASPNKPQDFRPRGLCCGFMKVKSQMKRHDIVFLKDKHRKIEVKIVEDIRPDRTARCRIEEIFSSRKQGNPESPKDIQELPIRSEFAAKQGVTKHEQANQRIGVPR